MLKGIIKLILFKIAPNTIPILIALWMFGTLGVGISDCSGLSGPRYNCDPNMIITPSIIIGSAFFYVRLKHSLKKTQ